MPSFFSRVFRPVKLALMLVADIIVIIVLAHTPLVLVVWQYVILVFLLNFAIGMVYDTLHPVFKSTHQPPVK